MTPEGRVKKEVKKVLKRYEPHVDGSWPVPSGFGKSTLDYVGCAQGVFFSIETKAPGETPTPRQYDMIRRIHQAGGVVFVIDGTPDTTTYDELDQFLKKATQNVTCAGKPQAQAGGGPLRHDGGKSLPDRKAA